MNDSSSPRRRLGPWLIAAVVLVPVAAIAVAYMLFLSDDSPDELTLSDPPATQGGTTPATGGGSSTGLASTLEGTWTVTGGSLAGYRVRETLASIAAPSDAVARTGAVTGSVVLAGDGTRLVAEAVTVEVDVSTLKSDPAEPRRDNRIRTTGLETDLFPKATFTSTAPAALPDNLAAGEAVKSEITGDLTIHGVTRRVTIPVDVRVIGSEGEVVGALKFPFSDFGMTPPNIGDFVSVESDATLEFSLRLVRA